MIAHWWGFFLWAATVAMIVGHVVYKGDRL